MTITLAQAKKLAYDAFIYGYPAVDNYRVIYEGAVKSGLAFNTFYGTPTLSTHVDKVVVAPNNDTAYSKSWVDLSGGPVELTVPPITDRYWSFQFIDSFTNNVHYMGSRTTGGGDRSLLIVPPDWADVPPAREGVEVFRCPTKLLFLLGRTQILDGDTDGAGRIMQAYTLRRQGDGPLASIPWLPIDEKLGKDADAFFRYLNLSLTYFQGPNEASPVDRDLMARLADIGVGPGKTFDPVALGPEVMRALGAGIMEADDKIQKDAFSPKAGWSVAPMNNEYFGSDQEAYDFRARIVRAGIFANSPQEAVYPMIASLATGERLNTANGASYTLKLKERPPVDQTVGGFWSVTMYNEEQYLVDNPNDVEPRTYSLGSQTKLLTTDGSADGPVELLIQFDKPEGDVNWLPAPDGPFQLILRVYCPQQSVLDSEYVLPEITRNTSA